MTQRRSVIGEAMASLNLDDPPSVRTAEGKFASRAYGFFLRIHDVRAIPAHIPRIARALKAEEDRVWHLFFKYMRGADEPWRA